MARDHWIKYSLDIREVTLVIRETFYLFLLECLITRDDFIWRQLTDIWSSDDYRWPSGVTDFVTGILRYDVHISPSDHQRRSILCQIFVTLILRRKRSIVIGLQMWLPETMVADHQKHLVGHQRCLILRHVFLVTRTDRALWYVIVMMVIRWHCWWSLGVLDWSAEITSGHQEQTS